MEFQHHAQHNRSFLRWSLVILLLVIASMACNLSAPAPPPSSPTIAATNTLPPTRTLQPTGQLPTVVPVTPLAPAQFATITPLPPLQASPVVIVPTFTPVPSATPFPTALPTSTPFPPTNVSITSPVTGNIIAGIIQVHGNAQHPLFVQYQLEFSPDPGDLWALIPGSIANFQVANGLLGLWDTRRTPDGLYQLRLRVFTTDGSSAVAVVRNLRVSNQTATPPPSATPTPTATNTPTFTPIPTSTSIPTGTPTHTPTSTLTVTWTPTATFTEVPGATETPTATPTATPLPLADLNAIPVIPELPPEMRVLLRAIYDNGVTNFGNRSTVFARSGDDNTAHTAFLTDFGNGVYNLDSYADLQNVIDLYTSTTVREASGVPRNSFNVTSFAAAPNWSTVDVLDVNRADPAGCIVPEETPLECEIRLSRPAVLLIMFGTRDLETLLNTPETFLANLQAIIDTATNNGVIPVLSTIPERRDGSFTPEQVLRFNTEIVNVAATSGIPLWNLWLALRDLSNSGLSADGVTLSFEPGIGATNLSINGLAYGFNQRNLTALQTLARIWTTIFPEAAPPPSPTPTATETLTETPTEVAVLPSDTPTATPTFTETPTLTPTFTETPTEEPPTPTPTFTETPTEEPPTPTSTSTETPTETQAPLPTETFTPPIIHPFPDTTDGIHVFNDQLPDPLSDAQAQFAAARYAGTQKMRPVVTHQLRAYNPSFIVLHYRLGLGLGYQTPDAACNYSGNFIQIIEGEWRQEWPDPVGDSWFAPYNGQNVYNCDWGWFLMNLDDPAWRSYYLGEVARQLSVNDNDGVFLDSLSVPNYLGWDRYNPQLPPEDATYEAAWSASIASWIDFLRANLNGAYVVPNVGSHVNARDATDYSRADGVMIEGFGFDTWQSFGQADWELQLNRALSFANRGQVLILQSYPDVGNVNARLFSLASYLLIKGNRTFVNIDFGIGIEWLPEYGIPIGSPTQGAGSLGELFRGDWGVYARTFTNGLSLVNPGSAPVTISLGGPLYLAQPIGGGMVGGDGFVPAEWTVNYAEVTEITLDPGQAAILLNTP